MAERSSVWPWFETPRGARLLTHEVLLRQCLEMADRPAGRDRLRACHDRIRVDAVMPVELRERAGLPEMFDAECARAMAVDRTEPAERRRMRIGDRHDAAMQR